MEIYNGTYCATYSDLAGIITQKALQHRIQRGTITQVRKACAGSPALVAVDSLPTAIRIEVQRRFPDLQAEAESRVFVETISISGEATTFYAEYKIDGIRGLDTEKQALYTNNAAIMEAFRIVLERGDSARSKVSRPHVNRGEFWARAAKALPRIADTYNHTSSSAMAVVIMRYLYQASIRTPTQVPFKQRNKEHLWFASSPTTEILTTNKWHACITP